MLPTPAVSTCMNTMVAGPGYCDQDVEQHERANTMAAMDSETFCKATSKAPLSVYTSKRSLAARTGCWAAQVNCNT